MKAHVASLALFLFLSGAAVSAMQPPTSRDALSGRVVDADGATPMAGVTVAVGRFTRFTRRFILKDTTKTAADGTFDIAVPEGAREEGLVIRVQHEGRATVTQRVLPEQNALGDFPLAPGFILRGRVTDRVTGDPLVGVEVVVEFLWALTDAQGNFELQGLRRDVMAATITATTSNYVPFQSTLDLVGEEGSTAIGLKRGRVVSVLVADDAGAPVAGAEVVARIPTAVAYSAIERATYSVRTDDSGRALVQGLPPGYPVVIEAGKEGMIPGQSHVLRSHASRAEAEKAGAVVGVRLAGPSTRTMEVTVEDETGRPIPGARVRLRPLVEPRLAFGGPPRIDADRGGYRQAIADARGRVTFGALPRAPLTCEVSAAGFTTRLEYWPAGENSPREVTLPLDPRPVGTRVPWHRNLAEAWQRAEAERLPLLVSMTMDGEAANEYMAKNHWHEPEIVRVARELPVLLATVFQHEEKDGACQKYGTISCAEHQAVEPWAVSEFIDRADFQVPRQIFATTDGRVLMHREFYLSERELIRMMVRALRIVNPARAVLLARERLAGLRGRLATDAAAREALVALVDSGDEHAAALLLDLVEAGVAAAEREALANALVPRALLLGGSAWRALIADPVPAVRLAAVNALADIPDDSDGQALLRDRLWDEDPKVRAAVHAALGVAFRDGSWFVARPGQGERWRIVGELLRVAEPATIADLDRLVSDAAGDRRNHLLRRLAERTGDETAERLVRREALERRGFFSMPGLIALGKLAPGFHGKEGLREALTQRFREEEPAAVRGAVIEALGALPGPEVTQALRAALQEDAAEIAARAGMRLAARGDRRALQTLAAHADDHVLGPRIVQVLSAAWRAAQPRSAEEWREWLERRGRGLR